MMAVVHDRPRLKPIVRQLQTIRALAESCARQLTGWSGSTEDLPFEGRRHLLAKERQTRQTTQTAKDYRLNFLRALKPEHPLHPSPEARAARGEPME